MVLNVLLSLAASQLLPYPGQAYLGQLKGKAGSCGLVAWQGMAPAKYLLSEEEKRSLEVFFNELERRWDSANQVERGKLVGQYLRLLEDKQAPGPLGLKHFPYLTMAVTCGGRTVRAGLAVLPRFEGAMLVLVDPGNGEFANIYDVASGLRFRRQLDQFYRAMAAEGKAPQLEGKLKEEMEEAEKAWAKARSRVWAVGGRTLLDCPEKCDPQDLQAAWSAVRQESQEAFRAVLGALSRGEQEDPEAEPAVPEGRGFLPPRVLLTWPSSLGENPYLGAQWEVAPVEKYPSFAAPSEEIVRQLAGSPKLRLPEFDSDHPARLLTVIHKAIR